METKTPQDNEGSTEFSNEQTSTTTQTSIDGAATSPAVESSQVRSRRRRCVDGVCSTKASLPSSTTESSVDEESNTISSRRRRRDVTTTMTVGSTEATTPTGPSTTSSVIMMRRRRETSTTQSPDESTTLDYHTEISTTETTTQKSV